MNVAFSELMIKHEITGSSYLQVIHDYAKTAQLPSGPMVSNTQAKLIEAMFSSLEKHSKKIGVDDYDEVPSLFTPFMTLGFGICTCAFAVNVVIAPRFAAVYAHDMKFKISIDGVEKSGLVTVVDEVVNAVLKGLDLQ